ncbi:MAG: branched-chain amino acid ABC transporter substrate-binding protein [Flexilinea sp.]
MKKSFLFVISILLVFSIVLTGCAKKAEETVDTAEVAVEEVAATAADVVEEIADEAKEPAADSEAEVAEPAEDAAKPAAEAVEAEKSAADMTRCDADGGCAVIKPGEAIKLGMAGPLTGEYAMYGVDISDSEKIAVDELEPLEGFDWELLAEDSVGSSEAAVSIANKWITDPTFVAVAGNVLTGESAAVIPIMEKAFIPMLSASATGADLTEDNTVFNRIVFQDATQGKFAAEFIVNTLGYKNIAVLHDGLDYGKGIADTVRDTLVDMGIEPVAYEALTPGEADYSAVLTSIASKKPDIIYYGGYTAELSVIANQMGQVGLKGVPVFSDDGAFGVEFIEKAGENAEGCYGTTSIPADSEEKLAFDAKYEEVLGRKAGTKTPFPWFSYDVIQALAYVTRQVAFVGDDGNLYIPRAEMVNAVRNLSGYQGITGEITCDEVGECNASGPTFYIVEGGAWKLASK